MISIRHFRAMLLAELILTLLAPYALYFRINALPPELQKFASDQFSGADSAQQFATIVGLAIYIAAIAAVIGLWTLRRWGIQAFVIRWLITFFYCLMSPPAVGESFSTTLGFIAFTLTGIIIGLVLFSPFKEHFKKSRPDPDAAP